MSKQLESELEDDLSAAAHRASAAGLNLEAIIKSLEDRASFAKYLLRTHAKKVFPPVVSAETAMRRALCRE
jgi:hypothetical protein